MHRLVFETFYRREVIRVFSTRQFLPLFGLTVRYCSFGPIGASQTVGGNTMGKKIAVFGIYPSRADAEYAVDTLRQESFRNTDVSVLFPANEASKSIGHEKSTKAPEGAAAGAATGAVAGGALGWLAGI